MIRDCENSGATQGDAYLYDFRNRAWSFHPDLLTASAGKYTNFITDYNGDLVIGRKSSTNIITEKFSYDTLGDHPANTVLLATKDIDFGYPSLKKKIYSITVTYKSQAAQTDPIRYTTNSSESASPTSITGNFVATGDVWKILTCNLSTPITCQSIAILIINPTNSSGSSPGIQINDITLEYRILSHATVASTT